MIKKLENLDQAIKQASRDVSSDTLTIKQVEVEGNYPKQENLQCTHATLVCSCRPPVTISLFVTVLPAPVFSADTEKNHNRIHYPGGFQFS